MKKILVVIVVAVGLILIFTQGSESITNDIAQPTATGTDESTTSVKENAGLTTYAAQDIRAASSAFSFSFAMQDDWRAFGLAEPEALNLYDPILATSSDSTLGQSQIFITAFIANDFQTEEEINVLSRTEHEVVGYPAVTYLISPNGSGLFTDHPAWRGEPHKITQIRLSNENPSLFYTFAKRPSLSDAEFQRFLNSLQL